MTEAEFNSWLRSQAPRCVLVEVGGLFLSSRAYVTAPDDATAPNRMYQAVVEGGVAFTESLGLNGAGRASYGDIELNNVDGSLDGWLARVWQNQPVQVYLGDPSWPRADFRLVMAGVCAGIKTRTPQRLNLVLRDKLERLRGAASEVLIGGAGQNKDRLKPICLGECHNVSPVAVDAAGETFVWHAGPAERTIEVRDNAVPVGATQDLAQARFSLIASPAGQVTASVQGDKTGGVYRNTVGALVELLATQYGPVGERFSADDIDAANFATFEAAHRQPVGLYSADRITVVDACNQLAESVGAQLAMSRLGTLRLLKLQLPPAGTPREIRPTDYVHGSLKISDTTDVVAGVRLGYCRNWTPQQDIETGIPAAHRDLFGQEWLTVVAKDETVAALYGLDTETEQVNTLLLREQDAQAEAARRLALWSVPRTVYSLTGFAQLLTLDLGQAVKLYGNRFGLDAGKTGVVIGLKSDWIKGRVDVEIIV